MSGFDFGVFSVFSTVIIIYALITVLQKIFFKHGNPPKKEFDERQELVRNRGYKYAFYTLMCCTILISIFDISEEQTDIRSLLTFASVGLAVIVYGAYTIWNDGYLTLQENPKSALWILSIECILTLPLGTVMLLDGYAMNLSLFEPLFLLFSGFMSLILVVLILLKQAYRKKTEEPED